MSKIIPDQEKGAEAETREGEDKNTPLEEKWTSIRSQALSYLNSRKASYDRLSAQKKARLREVSLHCVFVVLFSWVALSARDTSEAHFLVAGIRDELTGTPIPTICSRSLTFFDVNNVDDLWNWLNLVFVPNLYPDDLNANISSSYYLGSNVFVTGVTLRQVRVQATPCNGTELPSNLRSRITTCTFPFSSSTEDTSPNPEVFDPETGLVSQWPQTFDWAYVNSTDSSLIDSAFDLSYGNGGYVLQLGDTQNIALSRLATAQSVSFFSQAQTRAVFAEFVLYNAATNLYVSVILQFEIPATAGITPTASFRAVNLYRAGRTNSLLGLIFEIVVFFFVLLFICIEAWNIFQQKFAYFKDGYNLFTLLNILIFIVVIVMECVTVYQADQALNLEGTDFQNFNIQKLIYWTYQVYNWNAFNALLTWLKLLKYVDLVSKKSTQLALTLAKAASSIMVLMVLFVILYCGYGIAFFMAFGQDVEDYRSLDTSIVSLFRAMLGDFDFTILQDANRVLGPILFITFIILIIFCLLNMFMAVIMSSYDAVVEELGKTPDELSNSIRKSVRRLIVRAFRKKNDDAAKRLAESGDRVLTEKELEEIFELEHEQFARMGIFNPQYLISVADTDMDGFVSLSEMQRMQVVDDDHKEEKEKVTAEELMIQLQDEQKAQRVLLTQLLRKLQTISFDDSDSATDRRP